MRNTPSQKYRIQFISPWLLAAAIGILILIIVVFIANNIRKEKTYITNALFHKGQAIIRFVGAGTRSSIMMGMQGAVQTQNLIEQASKDSDIYYIAVVDKTGKILAHSDPQKINTTINRDPEIFQELNVFGTWQIISSEDNKEKIFEIVSPFNPFRKGKRRFMRKGMQGMRGSSAQENFFLNKPLDAQNDSNSALDTTQPLPTSPADNWCRIFGGPGQPGPGEYSIVVGLDMREMEAAITQDHYQIIFLSVALLLVGAGGWFSLLTIQGYRVSQNTLNHMQAFTGLLISRLPIGIIATDNNGVIKTCNEVAAGMTGIPAKKSFNKKPDGLIPDELTDLLKIDETEEVLDREISLFTETKKELALHLSSVPIIDAQKTYMGRVLLMHDLTALKKLEKELQRSDRLAALGKMAAGVAHEVRNPLSSIKGFATVLGAKFSQESEEKKVAKLLVNEVERLNRSITELLNYAKPLPLALTPIDMNSLLQDSLRLIESDAGACNINIKSSVDGNLPPLDIDPDKINQVFLNLYLNAIQAMEEGGELTVSAHKAATANMIDIVIKDTGCGIKDENLGKIIDPYFTTKKNGTGLGLAIVYKIIEEHGGTIDFESQIDVGTTVTVSLPTKNSV
jgi:two-component system sensor histidine kinase HydH